MAKILGGSASRLEMYGLFVAAVILIGGGVSGAIVLSSDSATVPPAVIQSPVETQSGGFPESGPTSSQVAPGEQIQPFNGAETRANPLTGRTESETEITTSPNVGETEDQRIERLQQARDEFAAANPVARFEDITILSCTELPVYGKENPTTIVDTAILVRYSITYEAFHQMNSYSFVNPGLSVYQTMESDARQMVTSNSAFAPQVQLQLNPGRHSMVLHGLRFLSNTSVRNVEVRFGPADSTFGYAQFDLPSIGPICG
jgi:hypothetical protein